jgi:hypothetical protein
VQNEGELFGEIEALVRQHVSEDKDKDILLQCLTVLQEETDKNHRTSGSLLFFRRNGSAIHGRLFSSRSNIVE